MRRDAPSPSPRKRRTPGARAPCATPVTVIARVYAFDLSVRTAYLDAARGYFNGPTVFPLRPKAARRGRANVEIVRAGWAIFGRTWRVATTLPRRPARRRAGFGRYRAANYDELIDHPVEMSDFAAGRRSLRAARVTTSPSPAGIAATSIGSHATSPRICQWQIDLFGGAPDSRAPFDRYLFPARRVSATVTADSSIGRAPSLLCNRDELPVPGVAGDHATTTARLLGLRESRVLPRAGT